MREEAELHKKRRMFAIINSTLHVAPERDERSHIEWFLAEGWVTSAKDSRFEEIIRGFVDHRGVFAYRGQNFLSIFVLRHLAAQTQNLKTKLGLSGETLVWIGMVQGLIGDEWAGEFSVGSIDKVILGA